jgi:hypothetical protein
VYSKEENKALYGRKKVMKIPKSDKGGGRCGYFALWSLCQSIPDMVRNLHIFNVSYWGD